MLRPNLRGRLSALAALLLLPLASLASSGGPTQSFYIIFSDQIENASSFPAQARAPVILASAATVYCLNQPLLFLDAAGVSVIAVPVTVGLASIVVVLLAAVVYLTEAVHVTLQLAGVPERR
jgi:hypothetical protein